MTTILDQISAQAEKLMKQRAFNALFDVFISNQLPPDQLVIFYKRKSSIFSLSQFWTSKLPMLYVSQVLSSDLKVKFLHAYFGDDSFCNGELTERLLQEQFDETIRFIKFTRCFNRAAFWIALNDIKSVIPRLDVHLLEWAIIREKRSRIEIDLRNEDAYLLKFPLQELLIGYSVCYTLFKTQSTIAGNKAAQTEIEMAIVEEIGRIIKLFAANNKFANQTQYDTNEKLQIQIGYLLNSSNNPLLLQFLFERMQKMIDLKSEAGRIDLYCCGYADFTSTKASHTIKLNKAYADFVFNNKKSQPEEFYLTGMDFDLGHVQDLIKKRVSGEDEVKQFRYYGVPIEIEHNSRKIDFRKVFKLLKHISVYKGPPEPSNVVPKDFESTFGDNEIASLFDYNQLVNDISVFFNWSKSEAEDIIQFLAIDTNESAIKKEWQHNPFLISGDKILWLGVFLRDRRWENILLNKIKAEKSLENVVGKISKNLELNVIKLFSSAGFKAFGIPRFTTESGKSGDIDVLAYKNGCLILAEVKSGARSDDFSHARYSEIVRLEGHAAEQLEKIEEYVCEKWKQIKREYGIETPKPIDKIRLFPLIITDYFEGDLNLYKDHYHKTSLLELDVILSNNKQRLFNAYHLLQFFTNANNSNFKHNPIKNSYDLWNGKKSLSTEQLISIIESNAVWKELEDVWDFPLQEFPL